MASKVGVCNLCTVSDAGKDLASLSDLSHDSRMKGGWVYIITNRPNGTLYVGVTSDIAKRAWEHREGVVDGFSKRYGLKRLVYAERHEDITDAIRREKRMKTWPRAWKINLIREANPSWKDLYQALL